jgi:SAM-dependent methyltransferase
MLEEQGFPMRIFDPFFAPDTEALDHDYDFITCTETAEHFFDPGREFRRLDRLLRPGGWLGVMTEVVDEDRSFQEWYYVRDPTHVAFYRRSTLEWIATSFGWSVEFPHRNVALFRKPGGANPHPPYLDGRWAWTFRSVPRRTCVSPRLTIRRPGVSSDARPAPPGGTP